MIKLLVRACIIFLIFVPSKKSMAYSVLHTSDGSELRWYQPVIYYYISVDGFSDFHPEEAIQVARTCFETWASENLGVEFEYSGTTDIKDAEDDNYNVIFFVQDPTRWEEIFKGQGTALAMTRTWASRSGEILAFDLAFNDGSYGFTNTEDPDAIGIDYANTLTHEIGHVLGLDHSEDLSATMFPTSPKGEISKRQLSEDDREGIRYLYREPLDIQCGCGVSANPQCEQGGIACDQGGGRGRGRDVGSLFILCVPLFLMRLRRIGFG